MIEVGRVGRRAAIGGNGYGRRLAFAAIRAIDRCGLPHIDGSEIGRQRSPFNKAWRRLRTFGRRFRPEGIKFMVEPWRRSPVAWTMFLPGVVGSPLELRCVVSSADPAYPPKTARGLILSLAMSRNRPTFLAADTSGPELERIKWTPVTGAVGRATLLAQPDRHGPVQPVCSIPHV